jgi:hypothetical protein
MKKPLRGGIVEKLVGKDNSGRGLREGGVGVAAELRSVIDERVVRDIARPVAGVERRFDRKGFVGGVMADLPGLGLMDPRKRVARGLREALPGTYAEQVGVLLRSLPADRGTLKFEGFRGLGYLNFVGAYGVGEVGVSLDALGTLTKYFTAEFDLRAPAGGGCPSRRRGW